ncbi:protein kinase [Prosthecobacter sp.]|uniref:serine/threonine protein kinase n=1 Tax=Prosthecobacter sp. TaxID=1965333 RepID=UPI002489DDB3|nr:protein kinase [Prosthecobacter sp.]MDI1315435.1 protein kinase [Prosthecobacter sp.]
MHPDQFQPEKIIAAGPSAKVYRGVETMTGRKVLIKALMEEHETVHPLDRERLQLLAPALMQMRHPQIAGLITLLPREDEFALVSEFMPGKNGRTFAAERQPAPNDLRALAVQLMHALLVGEHLRQPHGDPKPSNLIIVDHPGGGLFLQVQDWGLSLARQTQPPETLWFRAPELHAGGQPTTQSDLFTAAGSLFCIATNTAPAQGTTVEEVIRDWQGFNASHVLSHLRPDLDPPLRDWLAWLLNLAPPQRPHSVAQALDVLMHSMHMGFHYMPQQAPVMVPGAQTTMLVAAVAPSAAMPVQYAAPMRALPSAPKAAHSGAPKPKSVPAPASATLAKTAALPAAAAKTPATAPKKSFSRRGIVAVVLNLAALTVIGFCFWPTRQSVPSVQVSSAVSSEKPPAIATPLAMADSPKAAKPSSVKKAPATAVTAADAKVR